MTSREIAHPKMFLRAKWVLTTVICFGAPFVSFAFVSETNRLVTSRSQQFSRQSPAFLPPSTPFSIVKTTKQQSPTQLNFMGSDGGILGIGTPEVFTILLVGYFVLGPSDLYKLVKEIGKFVQNFRTFTTEATASLETNLESQLQLDEIRKAQRELTDAFSFRRSINVDEDMDAFEVNAKSPRMDSTEVAFGTGAATTLVGSRDEPSSSSDSSTKPKKRIRRRRVKKREPEPTLVEGEDFGFPSAEELMGGDVADVANNVPDLSEEDEIFDESLDAADKALQEANEELRKEAMEAEAEELRKERMERLEQSMGSQNGEEADAAANRFQAQLSGNWNDQILEKEDELSPLANIMERLALLEAEKQAADERLQEEFRRREENEEQFYREKRKLLEEAAAQVQADVYNLDKPPAVSEAPNSTVSKA